MTTMLRTYSGSFDPLHPTPGGIHPRDLAFGLAGKYRWCGQSPIRNTVAQHSVEVSVRLAPALREAHDLAAWGLLHDAAEAYLIDLPSPLKCRLGWLTDGQWVSWFKAERRILTAVAERFGLPWPAPEAVWVADKRMRATEARDLWHGEPDFAFDICTDAVPFDEPLGRRWPPAQAEAAWLARFDAIFGEIL